jgi:mRNA-degrading endonuclease RelE of RelBE toxin-antitoxin system
LTPIARRIKGATEALRVEPRRRLASRRSPVSVAGCASGLGDYRIVYEVHDRELVVLAIQTTEARSTIASHHALPGW